MAVKQKILIVDDDNNIAEQVLVSSIGGNGLTLAIRN